MSEKNFYQITFKMCHFKKKYCIKTQKNSAEKFLVRTIESRRSLSKKLTVKLNNSKRINI